MFWPDPSAPRLPLAEPRSARSTARDPARVHSRLVAVERHVVQGLAEPPGYAHVAVAAGARLVFTAGAVPLDEAGELVGPDDAGAQTEQVIENLLRQLEAGGASPDDVVKTTVYVAGASHEAQGAVWKVVQRSPLASVPSTLVGVALLGYRGQLVEIDAIAVIAG
jgi:enamine deaminase RidA (YjgF/YER057c/UK114 family)